MKFITPAVLLVQMITLSPSFPWFLDRGLEDRVNEMRVLFWNKKLFKLYSDYVDIQLKMRIGKSIETMRNDRKNVYRISKRLDFKGYKDFLKASHNEIVSRFFYQMLNPPKKKRRTIKNAAYLRLALLLSLMFAHFDDGMKIVDKEISGNFAKLRYSGNGFNMVTYFIFKNNMWYISDKDLIK